VKYDGIILDPPKFGRGPKGEIWEVYKSLPNLLDMCRACLSNNPLFVIVTVYAVRASAIHVAQAVDEMMKKYKGETRQRRTGDAREKREPPAFAGGLCEMVF
jgi:23S rRNA (cytosine1962-C5)-methyltransferase